MAHPKIDRKRFVRAYLACNRNGVEALRSMGVEGDNLKYIAYHIRKEPATAQMIHEAEREAFEATKITMEELYEHMGAIVRGEIDGVKPCDRIKAADLIADLERLKDRRLTLEGAVVISGDGNIQD